MLVYLVNFIQAFIPMALMTGMLLALAAPAGGRKPYRALAVAIACGLLAGGVIHPVALRQELLTSARAILQGVALLAVLLNAACLLLPPSGGRRGFALVRRGAEIFFITALAAVSAFTYAAFIAEQGISTNSVLNTELILNMAGIVTGVVFIALLIPLTAHISARCGERTVLGMLLFASALVAVQWSADLLLGMMRLGMVELTGTRVSIVAKTGKYANLFPYLQALMVTTLALAFYARRPVVTATELAGMQKAERRKARSGVLRELRWFRATLTSALVVLALLLYHDLYASRPPRISTPLRLTPDAKGQIRVKIDDLADGNLHRYAYVTDDGHVVRFFMINRSGGKKIGVVYDACMLCGDMGYLQEKNEVICIACNVRIFIPSIGKAGGCNPIPLPHEIEGGEVVVSALELDKGAKYFSEVVTVKVKDPVTGKELVSRDAPQRYEYKGRTYFFESVETLEKFKASPEKFIGDRESRYFRVQGFQGA